MLTYPSDSLPQIVCPMDEDALPPNPFCSAPPHSLPLPPVLPFSSVTPSRINDGISSNRRSGRIQGIRNQTPKKQINADGRAAQKPSRQNQSPYKRPRDAMVQVSQSEPPRVQRTHGPEEPNQDGLDFSVASEYHQKKEPQNAVPEEPNVTPEANVVEDFVENTTDMRTCIGLAVGHSVESTSKPKGWVIGPLFQSFKSKMASFTEIVMSPVKLFKANSAPQSLDYSHNPTEYQTHADGEFCVENPEFGRSDDDYQDAKTHQSSLSDDDLKHCRRLEFNTNSSDQVDGFAVTLNEKSSCDAVPLQPSLDSKETSQFGTASSSLSRPPICQSASHASNLKVLGVDEDPKDSPCPCPKPPARKHPGKRGKLNTVPTCGVEIESFPQTNVVKDTSDAVTDNNYYSPPGTDCLQQPDDDCGGGPTQKTGLDTRLDNGTPSAASLRRPKRGLNVNCHSQELSKRKRVIADSQETKKQDFVILDSDGSLLKRPKSQRKDTTSLNTMVDSEETLKTSRKTGSTRANRRCKGGQEMLVKLHQVLLQQADDKPDTRLDCSGKSTNDVDNKRKGSCIKAKPGSSSKRSKKRTSVSEVNANTDNGMDLETTMAITSTSQTQEVFPHPSDVKQLQYKSKATLKRKAKTQSPATELDITVSTSSVLSETFRDSSANSDSSHRVEREQSRKAGRKTTLSKRPKKDSKGPVKGSQSAEAEQCISNAATKDIQADDGRCTNSAEPVYFEMTPSESNGQPEVNCCQQINGTEKFDTEMLNFETNRHSSVVVSRKRQSARRSRRTDPQRRRCRILLHSWTHNTDSVKNSVTMEDADLTSDMSDASGKKFSSRLLRSYSCPEIPSLRLHDTPWITHSPQPSRVHQHPSTHSPAVAHLHKSPRRARRHTVCSVEVEREIAPLCLRKEIYPSRRSASYDGGSSPHLAPSLALSPSSSLTALASGFLSSPLAFLSKKSDSRGVVSSPLASTHVSPPPSSSFASPLSSAARHLPGFLHPRCDTSGTSSDSSISGNPLHCEIERRPQSEEEEEDDGEDTSSSSQEFEDVGLREEKALSDSEIKVVKKDEERGKVSSIRIRKTLPKPQNNLTPMGLPKAIRVKKKEFSLEEIYTNKNFSKPPESRLETIFEVPQSRRNGSESWFGQRRVKRFMEFLEVGEVRKPKKPLVGVGKTGNSTSRTRRGVSPKDEPSLSIQEVDSLLCSKLDQLNLWLIHDQSHS